MNLVTLGTFLLVASLVTYTMVYRFLTTGLVDSLVLTVNLGSLTLLVPLILRPGAVPQGVVLLVAVVLLALPMGLQLWFHLKYRQEQKECVHLALANHVNPDLPEVRRTELADAFADLAELLVDPDCDPLWHHGTTWRARKEQRSVFLAAVKATGLFSDIPEIELQISNGQWVGRWFRGSVAIPSLVVFVCAGAIFLAH